MTDATPPAPRTAAGRALLATRFAPTSGGTLLRDAILAIEAQARPAGASGPIVEVERLHELSADALWALGSFVQQEKQRRAPEVEWPAASDYRKARAALASDTGRVGALDVERLYLALYKVENPVATTPAREEYRRQKAAAIAAAYDAERQGEQE